MPKAKKKTPKRKPSKRKPSKAACRKPVQPDDKLAAMIGSLPRSALTKNLWNYIKTHGFGSKKERTAIQRKLAKYISRRGPGSSGSGTDSPGPGRAW